MAGGQEVLGNMSGLEPEYEVIGELGRGGLSLVYLARDRLLDREVAIKVIRSHDLDGGEALERFKREARVLARLQHPNIVTLYAAKALPDGSIALVMQRARGATLKEAIHRDGAFGPVRTEQVLRDLAEALAYLHDHGVVHRDLKPDNVCLDEDTGRALVSDLGIAKSDDVRADLTLTGMVIGTPAYMSPEQVDGGSLDGRSDLYSLGLVGYEMLTGQRPWQGDNLYSVIYKQKHDELEPLDRIRPDLPQLLREAIEGALAKDREQRWASARELLAHLGPADARDRSLRAPRPAAAGDLPAHPEQLDEAALARALEETATIQYRTAAAGPAPAGEFGALPAGAIGPLPMGAPASVSPDAASPNAANSESASAIMDAARALEAAKALGVEDADLAASGAWLRRRRARRLATAAIGTLLLAGSLAFLVAVNGAPTMAEQAIRVLGSLASGGPSAVDLDHTTAGGDAGAAPAVDRASGQRAAWLPSAAAVDRGPGSYTAGSIGPADIERGGMIASEGAAVPARSVATVAASGVDATASLLGTALADGFATSRRGDAPDASQPTAGAGELGTGVAGGQSAAATAAGQSAGATAPGRLEGGAVFGPAVSPEAAESTAGAGRSGVATAPGPSAAAPAAGRLRGAAFGALLSTDRADQALAAVRSMEPFVVIEWRAGALPTGRIRAGGSGEPAVFLPSRIGPRLRNPAAVARKLSELYPPILEQAGIADTVLVSISIDENGQVLESTISEPSMYALFNEAAREVVSVMDFTPAQEDGGSVPVRVEVPVIFTPGRAGR